MKFVGIIKLKNGHNIPVKIDADNEIKAKDEIKENISQVTNQEVEDIICASLNFGFNIITRGHQ